MINLTFPIKPLAKQSFRMTRDGRKYLDKDVVAYKKAIQAMAIKQMKENDYEFIEDNPIHISIVYCFKRPESTPKKIKDRMIKENCRFPKKTKPDIDNLTKAMLDALNGTVWRDDSLIFRLNATKFICEDDYIDVFIDAQKEY